MPDSTPRPDRAAPPLDTATAPQLTVITTCMGRLHQLRESLPRIVAQPGVSCVLVDYGCPDHAGDWATRNFPRVQVVRAGAVEHFNIARARNLGARMATTPWLCFIDADTLLPPDFAARLHAQLLAGSFLLAQPCPHELSGLVVCRREDFDRAGTYDELFEGWGSEDRDLYARLSRAGCQAGSFDAREVGFLPHGDAERTRHHAVKDRFLSLRINGMYLQIKTDLARLIGKIDLDWHDRRELYGRVRQRVLANPDGPARMDVGLPRSLAFTLPPGWDLKRSLHYAFEPFPPSADGA